MSRAKLDKIKITVIDKHYLLIVISEAEEVLNNKDSQAYIGGASEKKAQK